MYDPDKNLIKKEIMALIMSLPILLSLIFIFFNIYICILGFVLSAFLYSFLRYLNKKISREYLDLSKEIDFTTNNVAKSVIFKMPFPIVLLNNKKNIKWYNTEFKDLFITGENVDNINKIIPQLGETNFIGQTNIEPINVKKGDKYFSFYYHNVDGEEKTTFLYGIDNTKNEQVKKAFEEKRMVVMTIYVDNYDDLRINTPERVRPIVFAEIERVITKEVEKNFGILRKYENDKYIAIFNYIDYKKMHDDKFSILDHVRNIDKGNKLSPTLSIGVGIIGKNPYELYEDSKLGVDIALSRGGDQTVVKYGEVMEYFGGKSKATEKTSKVKSRVNSHAIRRLIDQASEVFIMGHENPDMDSIGSCLGIYEGALSRNKKAYIVLNEIGEPIKNLYTRSINGLKELKSNIKTGKEALEIIKPTSLVIICDNHRKNSAEAQYLLDKTEKIVIIDHHRRGKDYIKNALISYIEPYASSASELVTEILTYFDENFTARKEVAEALLAGITVDTKNFYYQTGVRTFEAASQLKRWGADSLAIKQMFKDDFQIVKYKSEVIANAQTYMNQFAISHFDREIDGSTLIASQAADDLLGIEGIKASFVLTKINKKIHISARSLGDVSVQLIMERLGGGGHLTSAASQLDMDIDKSTEILKKAIKEYFEEENDESYS
ncbi:MAG: DHH family phosphoesterase [Peptoniphilaceae bacterium]|nr:DHH family phosphoesterase [Peptoniphilaceae bacterium]MDD7383896.1 DHH family phosphoesterase [Peptoniphilaceae bacterium]MDY3738037.1 DHH family phosphoesterase [Peptoniphilaceae bacterium]